jgi:hypothetical protein
MASRQRIIMAWRGESVKALKSGGSVMAVSK